MKFLILMYQNVIKLKFNELKVKSDIKTFFILLSNKYVFLGKSNKYVILLFNEFFYTIYSVTC